MVILKKNKSFQVIFTFLYCTFIVKHYKLKGRENSINMHDSFIKSSHFKLI